jgi:hypothetical protein
MDKDFCSKVTNDFHKLGRIMRDDSQALADLKIENGMTVNLIKTKIVESAP